MGCRQRFLVGLLGFGMLGLPMIARADEGSPGAPDDAQQERLMQHYQKMIAYNLDNQHSLSSALVDSLMREYAGRGLGERIAAWAGC